MVRSIIVFICLFGFFSSALTAFLITWLFSKMVVKAVKNIFTPPDRHGESERVETFYVSQSSNSRNPIGFFVFGHISEYWFWKMFRAEIDDYATLGAKVQTMYLNQPSWNGKYFYLGKTPNRLGSEKVTVFMNPVFNEKVLTLIGGGPCARFKLEM